MRNHNVIILKDYCYSEKNKIYYLYEDYIENGDLDKEIAHHVQLKIDFTFTV